MKKQTILRILLDSVFLIVFNVFFFVLGGTDHTTSVWLSYGFIHFAYFMVLLTPLLSGKGDNPTILWMPVHTVSTTYFFAAFIAGLVFILLAPDSVKAPLLIQIAIAGVYAVLLLTLLIANANTEASAEQQRDEKAWIDDAAARLNILMGKMEDKRARKEIEKAYDAVHASPVKSSESVASIEQSISGAVDALARAVNSGDMEAVIEQARMVTSLTEERNAFLKKRN